MGAPESADQFYGPLPTINPWLAPPTVRPSFSETRAGKHARDVFLKYDDDPVSHYHQAPKMTRGETAAALADEIERVIVLVMQAGRAERVLTLDDLRLIHRAVFGPVFGSRCLDMRTQSYPPVTYSLVTAIGPGGEMELTQMRGNSPRRVKRGLAADLEALDQEIRSLPATPAPNLMSVVRPVAQIYARIIKLHPWDDGNGRMALLVASYALARLGLPALAVAPTPAGRLALGRALTDTEGDGIDHLARHFAGIIRGSGSAQKP